MSCLAPGAAEDVGISPVPARMDVQHVRVRIRKLRGQGIPSEPTGNHQVGQFARRDSSRLVGGLRPIWDGHVKSGETVHEHLEGDDNANPVVGARRGTYGGLRR
jgi:hypothetical protein